VNRAVLRQLAEDRIQDAAALLAASRWSGAYYLAGYALECGLKACVLAHVENTGIIFIEKKYAEKCWTHDLELLVELANLQAAFATDLAVNPVLARNWGIARNWDETSRYQQKTQAQAQELFNAVANVPDGVLPWIRLRW
jgi:hypothetical protein